MTPTPHKALFDRRLLMFTGKGGVGKSTLVAACAVGLARQGRRPLVVELDHRASMEAIFDGSAIGYQPREVAPGVHAMSLDFESGLREYVNQHVKVPRVGDAILNNAALQRFFRAAPSVSEVATLNKLAALEREQSQGRFRWDPILVDLDATGHALMLMNLPRVMDGLVGDGPMRGLIDGFSALLCDRSRTILHLITLPRELPMQETRELYTKLQAEYRVPLGAVFVNRVPRPPVHDSASDLLEELATKAADAGDQRMIEDLALLRRVWRENRRAEASIQALGSDVELPLVKLPDLAGLPGEAALAQLGGEMINPGSGGGSR